MRRKFKMKIIPKTMAFLLLSISLGGHAQAFSERTDEIVRTVIFVDGFIDKDMHREFWEAVEKRDKREAEQLIKWVHSNILMIQEYQRELWESALISYGNGKVVKTERLIKLEAELPAVLKQSLPFIEDYLKGDSKQFRLFPASHYDRFPALA